MSTPQEPLDHKPRTLILCFDGTSNEYDADVSSLPPSAPMGISLTYYHQEHECGKIVRPSEEGLRRAVMLLPSV